jgi:hypothetical protein
MQIFSFVYICFDSPHFRNYIKANSFNLYFLEDLYIANLSLSRYPDLIIPKSGDHFDKLPPK